MRIDAAAALLAVLLAVAACAESEPGDLIVGSWVIDEKAQREEVARVSPGELEDFDEAFRTNLSLIRETFHRDGRYEVTNPLGGPFDDRWELVSEDETSLTVRSSGHTWVARRAAIGTKTHGRSDSVLTYTFSDPNHMAVETRMPVFGEEKAVSYFFVRVE
jgi:hypothetical protein